MPYPEYTNGEAVDILEDEGVGYAVMHYVDGTAFKDEETARLWSRAQDSLTGLIDYLQKETGRTVE